MYLIHEPDPETPIEETLGALDDLVHEGKVHYIGASNIEAWRLMRALWASDREGLVRLEWVQNNYSLLEREQEVEMLPACRDQELGFTPFSPLAGGWLTGKYRSGEDFPARSRMTLRPEPYGHLVNDRTFSAIEAFRQKAEERGVAMATLAMAWVLSHPQTTAIIVGPRRPAHLELACNALEVQLTEAERNELTTLFSPNKTS